MITFVYMGMDEPNHLSPGWYNGVTVGLYGNNNFELKISVFFLFSIQKFI